MLEVGREVLGFIYIRLFFAGTRAEIFFVAFCSVIVCVERWSSKSKSPLTEDSCLLVLQLGSKVSWDSTCSRVRTPEGRHHLVPVTEQQESTGTFLPPFSQGNAGQANAGSSWLAGMDRSYPSCHSGEGPGDLEIGRAPPPCCAADCFREDGWRQSAVRASWVLALLIVGSLTEHTVK